MTLYWIRNMMAKEMRTARATLERRPMLGETDDYTAFDPGYLQRAVDAIDDYFAQASLRGVLRANCAPEPRDQSEPRV